MTLKLKTLGSQKYKIILRFFLLLCIPVVFVTIFVYSCNSYYVNQYRSVLINSYSSDMNKFLKSIEDELINMSNDTSLLMSISSVNKLSYTSNTVEEITPKEAVEVQSALHSFSTRMNYINSISIINRSSGFVISTDGLYPLSQYFSQIYKYNAYPTEYWMSYRSKGENAKILPLTSVNYSSSSATEMVIPVVMSILGEESNSLIVFNMDANLIYDAFSAIKFTDNSKLMMVNNNTNEIMTSQNGNLSEIDLSTAETLYQTNYYLAANIKIDGQEHFLMQSQERYGTFGFTYVAAIPYSDIESNMHHITARILLFMSLLILTLLLYSCFASIRLSRPWNSIAKKLSNGFDVSNTNVISYVSDTINSLIDKNSNLAHNLAVALPHSQQKYLVDLLNNPTAASDDEMNSLIFKYEYFVSLAINISLKQNTDAGGFVLNAQLYSEAYKAIELIFASTFITFSLPSTNNTLYLILNVEGNQCKEQLDKEIEQIYSLFAADTEYIDLFMGKGNIYKGIDGLRLSHQEALSDIFHEMNSNRVQIIDNQILHEYSFGLYNENILVNYILTGHAAEAANFISETFEACSKSSPENRTRVYCGLFGALDKVIKIKKVAVADFKMKSEQEILNDILTYSDSYILNYLLRMAEDLTNLETPSGKARLAEIADYIKAHFNEELYLDGLAQTFNMAPKYLSKALKDHLGISFKAYLTQLRIAEAERLLKTTDSSINDICNATGFFNHSSFIRAFKQQNGISPSEYRTLHRKGKNNRQDVSNENQ